MPSSIGTPTLWIGFIGFVLLMLALDLGVFHRKAHAVRFREALAWSVVWVTLALLFNLGIYLRFGKKLALEFLAAYLTEEALSVDNLFVFLVIFSYFSVSPQHQHRVLFWGILGAILSRAAFILGASAILDRFHWAFYVFGAFLIFTGAKILLQKDEEVHPEKNPVLRVFKRLIPMTHAYHGARFLVRQQGRLLATPLLLVLVLVEATDILFAVDSVPAVVGLSRDRFIIFTSNIFAVLGLRSLFFVLAGSMEKFHYLKVGLGLILVFIGAKMCLEGLFPISIGVSLGVILGILACAVLGSLLKPLPEKPPLPEHLHGGKPVKGPFPGPSPSPDGEPEGSDR
jgi:tellurite resistance protein TerC